MSRAIIDISKDQKEKFYMYLKTKYQDIFANEIYEKGEERAKIDLILNKDLIIQDNILYEIRQLGKNGSSIYLGFKYYYENERIENIVYYMEEIFLSEYHNIFKAYRVKQKAQKEYYKNMIYNEIKKDIKECDKTLQEKLIILRTEEYKNELINYFKENEEDFNVDLFNELYFTIKNKIARELKEQIEIENMQQDNNIHIPLGWKVYGISKVIGKIFKI